MQYYLFIGSEPRFYSQWQGETFYAQPGEIREFTDPPTDGLWVPEGSVIQAKKSKSAPTSEGE